MPGRLVEGLFRDLRYGVRGIRRAAPLSLAVVATLVIGVGMNSVVFSVFNGLMFRPAVTREPASYAQIYLGLSGQWHRELHGPRTLGTLEDFAVARRATRTMAAVTASRWSSFTLDERHSVHVRGKFVSCNYLSAHLGPMQAGRGLVDGDCSAPGGGPVIVLTARGWNLHFGSDPGIVGGSLRLNSVPLTVIGIAPDDAAGDPVAAMFYVPYTLQPVLQGPADYFRAPAGRHAWLNLSGRLRAGRSLTEAQAELDVLARELDRLHPGQKTTMLVTGGAIIHEPETARTMPMLIALCAGTTGLILLMVCANVTMLLLARAVSRRHEMSVRLSLGASRAQLVRQLLIETMTLGGCAALASLVLAWYLPGRVAQMLTEFPLLDAFAPDWRVISVTLGLALLAGAIAGISPAFETLRFSLARALRPVGRVDSGQVSARLRGTLVANQLSISLALLIVLGTIARAQHGLMTLRLDYDAGATIVTSIDWARSGYAGASARAFFERLVPTLEAVPGVRAVALSSPPPFRGIIRRPVTVAADDRHTVLAPVRAVSPGLFPMVGVRLLEGRVFSELEGRTPGQLMPVVVSESFARTFFPGTASIGRRIRIGDGGPADIVGVVSDTSSIRPGERDEPLIYQPLYAASVASLSPVVHVSGDSAAVAATIRERVQMLDRRVTASPETIAATIAREAGRYAATIKVTAIPGGLALFLSLVGIYGLTAFASVQRMQEIGVRVAFGARPAQVLELFVRSLCRPLITGVLGGSALAMLSVLALRRTNLGLNLPAADPVAYVGAMVVLMTAALTATVIPALRAARKDPWACLREH